MNRPIFPLALCVLATSMGVAHADDPAVAFDRFKLPNGLEVITVVDHASPLVAVGGNLGIIPVPGWRQA